MGMVVLLVLWLAASCGVLSKPFANLCREKVEVFVLDQGIVSVGLSEPVAGANAFVTCFPLNNDSSTLGLIFSDALAVIGEAVVQVNFTVASFGHSVDVACAAESVDGIQYNRANSQGRSASFSIVSPSLRLFPSTSSFYGLPLDITAQLQPPLDENDGKVVFQCGSRLWNVTERKGICYRETNISLSSITFESGVNFQFLTLDQTSFSTSEGLFQLACCFSPSQSTSNNIPRYSNVTATHFISVAVSPLFNLSLATASDCFCDHTYSKCDVNCCCDEDCTEADVRLFATCAEISVQSHAENCDNPSTKEWNNLLCIRDDNSPNLGLHFVATDPTADETQFRDIKSRTDHFTYQRTIPSDPTETTSTQTQYKSGDVILTFSGAPLTLPTSTSSPSCTDFSPIAFLRDSKSTCHRIVSEFTCRTKSPLSFDYYLSSGDFFGCSAPVSIRTNPRSSIKVEDINFAYFCKNSTEEEDSVTAVEQCHENSPLAPVFDSASNTCMNAVESVKYVAFWNQGQILRVDVDVVLTNASGERIDQVNSVQFYYVPDAYVNGKAMKIVNFTSLANIWKSQSGNPGYSLRARASLMSGSVANGTTIELRDLKVWRSRGGQDCVDSSRETILFGEDSVSGCVIRLSRTDLRNNCSDVREVVRGEQEALFSASHIGRYGISDPTDLSDWVEIIRNTNISSDNTSLTNDSSAVTSYCANIPAQVNLVILITPLTEDYSADQWQVVGAKLGFDFVDWRYLCTECSETQAFSISSTVQYVKVKAKKPPRRKGSEKENICKYDACIGDILYPFLDTSEGLNHQKTIAWGLLVLLIIIVTLATIRPCLGRSR
ncbi:tectonic-2-like isoform X2 [Oscarella lobularis]